MIMCNNVYNEILMYDINDVINKCENINEIY